VFTTLHVELSTAKIVQGTRTLFPCQYEPKLEEPWINVRLTRQKLHSTHQCSINFTLNYDLEPYELVKRVRAFAGPYKVKVEWRTLDDSDATPLLPFFSIYDLHRALNCYHILKRSPLRRGPVFLEIVVLV